MSGKKVEQALQGMLNALFAYRVAVAAEDDMIDLHLFS